MIKVFLNRPVPVGEGKLGKIIEWKIDTGMISLSEWSNYYSDAVNHIEVDGEELRIIENHMKNVPINHTRSTMVYRGEFALFVMDNI